MTDVGTDGSGSPRSKGIGFFNLDLSAFEF